jgi:hypothetical protein
MTFLSELTVVHYPTKILGLMAIFAVIIVAPGAV